MQLEGSLSYREVLRQALDLLAESEGLELPGGEEGALAAALPTWPPFPEVPGALAELRERGWKLVPLSNTDSDFLAASLEAIGVPFDGSVVAGEIGSYKPAHGHWLVFRERFDPEPGRHVHVAARPSRLRTSSGSRWSGTTGSARRATFPAQPSF